MAEDVTTIGDMLMAGLKEAIVRTFFIQQSYWDPANQQVKYYGGDSAKLIDKAMALPEFQALLADIALEFAAKKDEFVELVATAIRKKSEVALEKEIKEDRYYINDAIRLALQQCSTEVAQEVISGDDRIRQAVEDKIGKGDWDIKITVAVSVTPTAA